MKKSILLAVAFLALVGLGWVGVFYYKNLRGVGPALFPPAGDIAYTDNTNSSSPKNDDITENWNQTDLPLKIQDPFFIFLVAKVPGARVLAMDSLGNLWVSQTNQGQITLIEMQDGKAVHQSVVFKNLKNPHGLAFDPDDSSVLYIAEETKISKTTVTANGMGPMAKIIDLPSGGNHYSRTIGFGPDGRLYVSIGSTCNVCREADERRASIWSLKKDGTDFKQVAKGLRNSVFFVWNKNDGKMWATEMGRDLLGDDTPPDEINIIDINVKDVLNYGWPNCYGKNIHDDAFDKNTYIRNPCMEPFEKESHIDIPAHSAPLGLAFVPNNTSWPSEFKNDLFVAYHGSWNRSVPTGYKVVRYHLDDAGNVLSSNDFLSGWVKGKAANGRPVDIIFAPGSGGRTRMYISDDKAGVIYGVDYPVEYNN